MQIHIPETIGRDRNVVGAMQGGNAIRRIPFFQRINTLQLTPATVLIGNNGSGKTSFLNALAAGCGLGGTDVRKQPGTEARIDETIHTYRILNPSHEFQEVFRFLGDRVIGRRGFAETDTEFLMAWNSNASHGEVSSNIMLNLVISPARDAMRAGVSTLLLLDEPENGQSPENMLGLCRLTQQLCGQCITRTNQSHIPVFFIVATQSPFVLAAAVSGGARSINLGGWNGPNPFPELTKLLT